MIYQTFKQSGNFVVSNSLGSNMKGGIASLFLKNSTLFGKLKAKIITIEVDEASCAGIFKEIKPDIFIITNIFRDQLDRYGEVDTTRNFIKKAIDQIPNSKILVNGDDQLLCDIKGPNVYYFGIKDIHEKNIKKKVKNHDLTKIIDGQRCVICGGEIKYKKNFYAHLGDYKCKICKSTRPNLAFFVNLKIFKENKKIIYLLNFKNCKITLRTNEIYSVYNKLSVYATLRLCGVSFEQIFKTLECHFVQNGRMEKFELAKPTILNLSKNPVGFNETIQLISNDCRKKDIIIIINDNVNDGRDVSWLWDVDFQKLFGESTLTLIVSGTRLYDIALCFLYKGRAVNYITNDVKRAIYISQYSKSEVCYILVNYSALFHTRSIIKEVVDEKRIA